jgi:hypothetical protein
MKSRRSLKMRDVAPPAKPQVVNAPNLIVAAEQSVTQMAANKSRTARH